MDVRKAYHIVNQLQEELAAEPDPATKSWYEQETRLQPGYIVAERTLEELSNVAALIGRVAEIKSLQSESEASASHIEGTLIEGTDEVELPSLPTAYETFYRRVSRKYVRDIRQYESDLSSIATAKKSKREHQELLARRKFARTFCDFQDVNGSEHLVLLGSMTDLDIILQVIEDERLAEEVIANCAQYVGRNPVEFTSEPARFASLIQHSITNKRFDPILQAVFEAEPQDIPQININLAHTAFEMLGEQEALKKLTAIFSLEEPYVPSAFAAESEKDAQEALINADPAKYVELGQIQGVYHLISHDITRDWDIDKNRLEVLKRWYAAHPEFNPSVSNLPPISQALLNELGQTTIYRCDPVKSTRLDGTNELSLTTAASDFLRRLMDSSSLFQKRMRHLAPYSYSQRTALRLIQGDGQYSQIIPLSPDITADIYLPLSRSMSEDEKQALASKITEFGNRIIKNAVHAKSEDRVKTYQPGSELSIVYESLYGDEKDGIIVYRPSVSFDAKTHSPLQQLAINTMAMLGVDHKRGIVHDNLEALSEQNHELRRIINDERTRFFGRRPVKFPMPADYQEIGFKSVDIRLDQDSRTLKARFDLMEGEVELELDREFNLMDTRRLALVPKGTPAYYENLILRLAKEWMCRYEVETSEGVVSENTKNSANMGHFGYLRVRESDGYQYQFRPPQAQACLEEQNLDLAVESERRKMLDPTNQGRNSTYVKESYDPGKPPLVVYASL